jgi:hypothetical protein
VGLTTVTESSMQPFMRCIHFTVQTNITGLTLTNYYSMHYQSLTHRSLKMAHDCLIYQHNDIHGLPEADILIRGHPRQQSLIEQQ